MMRSFYRLHGRILASDTPLPFLHPSTATTEPELQLTLSSRAARPRAATSWYRNETGDGPSVEIAHSEEDDAYLVTFADGTSFRADGSGQIALVDAPAHYTEDDLAAYALGPVLALTLHLQGAVLLHASAAVIDGRAVIFPGPAGSGKSTTVALLEQQGHEVLSDDLTEVSSEVPHTAMSSTGMLRLWSETVTSLYGDAGAFPDRAPSWDKKVVKVAAGTPREIGAILFLAGERRSTKPSLARLEPKQAWSRLIAESFTARLPGRVMSQRIFEVTASLADHVPAYTLTAPRLEHADGLGAWLDAALQERAR